jgi:hypothetical protein
MTPEIAKNALTFLARSTLHGNEVGPFLEVMQAIQEIASPRQSASAEPMPSVTTKEP